MSLKLYNIVSQLQITTIEVEFNFDKSISIDGWIGSYIRSGILTACSEIKVDGGKTLLEVIDAFPLAEGHPWYERLKSGFHKGYAIKPLSHLNHTSRRWCIDPNIPLKFELVLFGNIARYKREFVQAIINFGKIGIDGCIFNTYVWVNAPLTIKDICSTAMHGEVLALSFISPLSLFKRAETPDLHSYQARMNYIPSFYSMSHALANRVLRLAVLYGDCDIDFEAADHAVNEVESVAIRAELIQFDLRRHFFESKPRNKGGRIVFNGYTGSVVWGRDALPLIPIFCFGSTAMIGHHTVYGLGNYVVENRT